VKSEQEIREKIEKVTTLYKHVLDCGPATVAVNAPRALMQLEAKAILTSLYWALGENSPKFTCDNRELLDR
jgi:hypothetical protein